MAVKEVRCTTYTAEHRVQQGTHTAVSACLAFFFFFPKSTPDGVDVLTAGVFCSHTAVSAASLGASPHQQHWCLLIFLSDPPAALGPAQREVKDALCFALLTCKDRRDSKTNFRRSEKIYRSCSFFAVVAYLLSNVFCFSN